MTELWKEGLSKDRETNEHRVTNREARASSGHRALSERGLHREGQCH
jgi:hypothetical protein